MSILCVEELSLSTFLLLRASSVRWARKDPLKWGMHVGHVVEMLGGYHEL